MLLILLSLHLLAYTTRVTIVPTTVESTGREAMVVSTVLVCRKHDTDGNHSPQAPLKCVGTMPI